MGILILLLASSAMAQDAVKLDTFEVNALRVPIKMKETGRHMSVVTAEQIQEMAATSVDEVLQTFTGLEVQSRGGFGVQGDILLRGSTFTQTLILIDGMRLNDPLTGHFNANIPVALEEIDRIEILRGPASAIYGADAVGGVVNIITKTFSRAAEQTDASGEIKYGQNNLLIAEQGLYRSNGKNAFGAGVMVNTSAGEAIPENTALGLKGYNTSFDVVTVGASANFKLAEKSRLRFRTAYDHRAFDARYFYTTNVFDESFETTANWWSRVQWERTNKNGRTDLNLAYKRNTDEFIFSPAFPSTNNHVTQFFNTTFNHYQYVGDYLVLNGGLQFDRRAIESNDRGDHANTHFGAYATGIYRKGRSNLSVSLRGDQDTNYDFEFTPAASYSHVWERFVLRANIGKSIRAADYTERFVSNNLVNLTPGRNLGNPDLVAERSWSEEIGFDYYIKPSWSVSATGFSRQADNAIDYVLTNESEIGVVSTIGSLQSGADYYFAQNIYGVTTTGVEVQKIGRAHV